jgi:hypothetical protein
MLSESECMVDEVENYLDRLQALRIPWCKHCMWGSMYVCADHIFTIMYWDSYFWNVLLCSPAMHPRNCKCLRTERREPQVQRKLRTIIV